MRWKQSQKEKSSLQNRRVLSFILALVFHVIFLALLPYERYSRSSKQTPSKSLSVKIIKKNHRIKPQVIEAQLPQNAPSAPDLSYLGKTHHIAQKEQKLPAKNHTKKAEASRWLQESHNPKNTDPMHNIQALPRITEFDPARHEKKESNFYQKLLPSIDDLPSAPIGAFRDYIPESDIPEANFLDVNTSAYSLIAYFTKIRKQVDMAYTSPLSSLKKSPRIRSRLENNSQITLKGSSKAQLTVDRSGLVSEIKTVSSSGESELDKAWLHILNLAAPFPELPQHVRDSSLTFTYTLHYDYVLVGEEQTRRFYF